MAIVPFSTPPEVYSDTPLGAPLWNTYVKQNAEHQRAINSNRAIIGYATSSGVAGGSSVASTWNIRPLSYIQNGLADQASVDVGNNQFTLQPGRWLINVMCNIGGAGDCILGLYSVNASSFVASGMPCRAGTSAVASTVAYLNTYRHIESPTTFEIRQWATNSISGGMGPATTAPVGQQHTIIEVTLLTE